MSPALFLTILMAGPSIASNSACPSSRAIADQLSGLLPLQSTPPGTAVVVQLPDRLLIDLRPQDIVQGEQRSVEVGNDCDQRAKAAAVVIATWWPSENGKPVSHMAAAAPLHLPTRGQLELSAGAFACAVVGSVAPGTRIEASLHWHRFGVRAALSGTLAQSASLGGGRAEWRRASVELGPSYGTEHVRLDVGLLAGVVAVQGTRFSVNQSSSAATAGTTLGMRLAWRLGPVLPWIELRGIWWPLSQRAYVVDGNTLVQTDRALPHEEAQLGAGVAFSLP
jgi:hypothetical protein